MARRRRLLRRTVFRPAGVELATAAGLRIVQRAGVVLVDRRVPSAGCTSSRPSASAAARPRRAGSPVCGEIVDRLSGVSSKLSAAKRASASSSASARARPDARRGVSGKSSAEAAESGSRMLMADGRDLGILDAKRMASGSRLGRLPV